MNLRTFLAGGILLLGVAGPATAAFAADDPYTTAPPSSVLGVEIERGSTGALPTNAATAPSSGQTLPVTGTDLVGLTAIGLVAIGAGTVLVRRSRLRTVAATVTAEA